MADKLKFGFHWASACGGCEVAVLDIDEVILDVAALGDIVFWPVATDFKYKDLIGYPEDYIDVAFFNGAVRNSEELHIAQVLREKSKVLIAFGACAGLGGIPGLANFTTKEEIFKQAYERTFSTINPDKVWPQTEYEVPEGTVTIPELFEEVMTLNQVVDVDYYLPGCPPQPQWIVAAVLAVKEGNLPPKGAIIAGASSVCDECPREKTEEKQIKEIKRIHTSENDPDQCLLEQGIICCGTGTRSGCEAACIVAGQACRGCFGPAADVIDQGAKLVSSIAALIDSDDPEEIQRIVDQIDDPSGYFYRFSLPASLAFRKIDDAKEVDG